MLTHPLWPPPCLPRCCALRCTFVQTAKHCREDVVRVNYLAVFYCHNRVAMCFALVAWALALLLVMTIVAEVFLCPAIEVNRNSLFSLVTAARRDMPARQRLPRPTRQPCFARAPGRAQQCPLFSSSNSVA